MAFRRRPAAALAALAAALGVGVASAQGPNPPLYDCNAGLYNREFGWSAGKKEYCCQKENVGCNSQQHEQPTVVLASDTQPWAIKCSKDCNGENLCNQVCAGEQTQSHRCPAQDECPISTLCPHGTEPQDCAFSEWTEWAAEDGCSGLCHRQRAISQHNRCGGAPCEGSLTGTKECPRPESCEKQPEDCALSEWSEWGDCGSRVTCQKDRTRTVTRQARNGGQGCEGRLTETAACGDDCNVPQDCTFSVWMEWSQCTKKCGGGEQTRLRTIVTRAENGGRECAGAVSIKRACSTQPCEETTATDCMLGDWSEWTQCINGQQKMRRRIIATAATGDGEACTEPMAETAPCTDTEDNAPQDCQMGDWAMWTLCDRTCDGGQTIRQRKVASPAKNGGAACEDTIEETMMCNTHPCNIAVHPCRVSVWSAWSPCSTTCGNGQETRNRTILAEAQLGGVTCDFPLSEVRGCNEGSAAGAVENPECPVLDCSWSVWGDWSGCSATCDGGQRTRAKFIEQQATMGGAPCDPTDTEETEPCGEAPCHEAHCVDGAWEAWSDWSTCTKSCSGGYRFHTRSVAVEGNHCGKPATGVASEAESCNNDIECIQDTDCEYAEWGDWSTCADQCSGTRQRSRTVGVPAVGAGKPCGSEEEGGVLSEVEPCRGIGGDSSACAPTEPEDCQWGDWVEWSQCTTSCGGGQTVRSREVAKSGGNLYGRRLQETAYFPEAVVQPPPADTTSQEPMDCNTEYENWEVSWSDARKKYCCETEKRGCPPQPALESGAVPTGAQLCKGPANETKPCNTDACNVDAVDCVYGDWAVWSACTQCGGQRFRHRDIYQYADNGGTECELAAMEETEKCPRTCGPILYYCVWGVWDDWSGSCSTTCGAGTDQRSRSMVLTDQKPDDPMAIASTQKDCEGELVDVRECEGNPTCAESCQPQDCMLGDWTEWSSATCEGLCKRSREILTPNNECGRPCTGTLNATKSCPADCESKDCQLSDWTDWTTCASQYDQRYKTRKILVEPAFNGKGCDAALNVTGSCMTGPDAPVDCQVSAWGDWTDCDKTCGGGQRLRSRTIAQEAKNNGQACRSALQMTGACSTEPCASAATEVVSWDCQWSAWSLWSKCGGSNDEQTYRTRFIMHNAQGNGKACDGEMKETRGCAQGSSDSKNCILSTWSLWSACPVSCGGGQRSRSRDIESHAMGGGLQCEGALLEAEPCGSESCSAALGSHATACEVSDWSTWSDCSATCGEGFKERSREIAQPALAGADGCNSVLKQVEPCQQVLCQDVVDCKWGQWKEWGDCVPAPDICGVGYKQRSREIETLPSGGGRLCAPLVKDQVMPVTNCHGQPQCCVNGKWADWDDWAECSASCGQGTKKRVRRLAIKETWCGEPAPGGDVDYEGCDAGSCESDQDCMFSEWSAPSPCSSDCHGSRVRTRHIAKNGTGAGMGCDGPLELSERCNPAEGQAEPFSCEQYAAAAGETQDCIMGEWSDWSQCSSTCEQGTKHRVRAIQVHPAHGGESCEPALKEVASCHSGVPCFQGRVDCKWNDWTQWSECNHFNLRRRSRGIKEFPAAGGLSCEGAVRETEPCPGDSEGEKEKCGSETYVCGWGDWSLWTECSTTCGAGGERKRSRKLQVSEGTALEALTGSQQQQRPQQGPATFATQEFSVGSEGQALPELEAQLRDAQAQRMKEAVVAFALGSGTFAVMLFALRGARETLRRRSRGADASEYDRVPQQA